ncbi:MAG: gdhB 3 [Fibrobacteres bacterium]|nr:gdhB 3 [Fibrobacterota bacterium]
MSKFQSALRRFRIPAFFAGAVVAASLHPAYGAPLKGRSVFESVNVMAMAMVHVGDARVFIAQRNGTITVFPNKYAKTGLPFMKVASTSCLCINDESGLIGMAFHPDFLVKDAYGYGRFYLYYTVNSSGHDGLFEYKVLGDPATSTQGDPASRRQLLLITTGGMHHNSGSLAFDNAKNLFFGIGDGNKGETSRAWAQSLDVFHGKILRIKVDAKDPGKEYAIPADNPEWPGKGRSEIYAMGLRNPYRIHWDKAAYGGKGALIAGDVGQDTWEEVDIIQAGRNYGWGNMEGNACVTGSCEAYAKPLHAYPSGGAAVIGGVVYRGKAMPSRTGQYFFADYYYKMKVMDNPYAAAPAVTEIGSFNHEPIFSFGEDSEGEVYALNWNGIFILEETAPTAMAPAPRRASGSGIPGSGTLRADPDYGLELRDLRGRHRLDRGAWVGIPAR